MVKLFMHALFLLCVLPAMAQDFLVEADIEPAEVHVNAQAVYRLRVLHAVDVRELRIVAPSARLADFRQIGQERVFEAQRDGRRYRVHERSYAVFPFASGTLELSGAYASGRVAQGGSVRLNAPARPLTVLPVDIEADGRPWLPANALSLSEQWTALADGAQRRVVRIEASGVDASQLPSLQIEADGMTVQAEAPRIENRFEGERNIGVHEQAFVLTPTRDGKIVVPAVQLHWWQVDADSAALATLPARMFLIGTPDMTDNVKVTAPAATGALGATLAALFAFLLYQRRGGLRIAWQLRRAGNPRAVRDGLLQVAATVWPDAPPATLGALAERLHNREARAALMQIERALYGPACPASNVCSGAALRSAASEARRAIAMMAAKHVKNAPEETYR